VRPSLGTWLAESSNYSTRSMLIDYGIDARTIPHVSYVDVLSGRVPARYFKGKRVVVGATAVEMGDRYVTPRDGILPGVVIQALAAESMLQNRMIWESGSGVASLGIIILCGLYFRLNHSRGSLYSIVCAVGAFGLSAILPFVMYQFSPVWLNSSGWCLCSLAAIVYFTTKKLQEIFAGKSLFDSETKLPNRRKLQIDLAVSTGGTKIIHVCILDNLPALRAALPQQAITAVMTSAAGRFSVMMEGAGIYHLSSGVLACVQTQDTGRAAEFALQVSQAFQKPLDIADQRVDVQLSIGIADAADLSAEAAIESAVMAAGQAHTLAMPFAWFSRANQAVHQDHLSMLSDLRDDLEAHRLTLVYQPKFDVAADRVTKVEALLRWNHATRGFVPPDIFIVAAEQGGLIHDITRYVLAKALNDCAVWQRNGYDVGVAINISTTDLVQPGFVAHVTQLIAAQALAASHITLEITETAILKSPAQVAEALKELRAFGVRLSIDDYGTGQSSLAYVRTLPVHELKIDKSFVMKLATSPQDAVLVRSTIAMAHELGLQVVAEGVEDAASATMLAQFGCDYLQGYHISRPISVSALCTWLQPDMTEQRVA
jgi:diguanylate cyclase